MKNIIIFAVLAASFGCIDAPVKPNVVEPDTSWYCTPIAPMEQTKRAVGMRGKFHPVGATLKIGFIGGTETQKNIVKTAYASWKQSANLNFEYPAAGPYNIRVSFNPGSAWSYVGSDCNQIPQSSPTLNFGFGGRSTMDHESGHSLALLHEMQLPGGICWNEANVISDLSGSPNFWNLSTIRFNVLDYHKPENIITSQYDPISIMHYSVKASWTCNNIAVPGGTSISAKDREFIAIMYPYPIIPPTGNVTITKAQRDDIISRLSKSKVNADNVLLAANKAKIDADSALMQTKKIFGL